MELSILQVSGSFHFVELNGKKYILDNTTITPKSYFWGVRTEFITVDLSESYDNDTLLRVQKNNLGIPVIVLMTLPIVNLMYSFLESLFSNYIIGQNFFLKLLLFIISILVGYIFYFVLVRRENRNIREKLANRKKLKLVLRTDDRRNFGLGSLCGMLLAFCFIWYLFQNDGPILILSGLLSFCYFTFTYNILSVGAAYQTNHLIFEKIEEVSE